MTFQTSFNQQAAKVAEIAAASVRCGTTAAGTPVFLIPEDRIGVPAFSDFLEKAGVESSYMTSVGWGLKAAGETAEAAVASVCSLLQNALEPNLKPTVLFDPTTGEYWPFFVLLTDAQLQRANEVDLMLPEQIAALRKLLHIVEQQEVVRHAAAKVLLFASGREDDFFDTGWIEPAQAEAIATVIYGVQQHGFQNGVIVERVIGRKTLRKLAKKFGGAA